MDFLKNFSLEGKIAWITGASYGIGFAIARAFAAAGATIVFNDISEENKNKGLAAYQEAGIPAHGYVCDVTDEEAVNATVKQIEAEVGTVDILVNNAGIIKRIPMLEMSAADFRKVVDVDLNAPFIVSKAVIPGMIKKGHGKIINICSMMSELGRETVSAYAAAKGGLKMLTRNICSEYGEANIQCNGIGPGYIATPQTAPLRERQPDGSPLRSVHHRQDPGGPLGHPGGPDGPGGVPGLRRQQLCQRPHSVCGRRHPGLHRQAAVNPSRYAHCRFPGPGRLRPGLPPRGQRPDGAPSGPPRGAHLPRGRLPLLLRPGAGPGGYALLHRGL